MRLVLLALGCTALLAACGEREAVIAASQPSAGQVAAASTPPKVSFYAASRFAEQATFGPTPALIAELQAKGFEKWIDDQLALPASQIDPEPYIDWNTLTIDVNDTRRFQSEVVRQFLVAPDQLRWRVTWSLSQYIVVSIQKLDHAGVAMWANDLQRRSLGNYGELIKGLTLSSPMGFYLDNAQNRPKGDDCPTCVPNENYARELMQLFTLGVYALNADGSIRRDVRGQPVETYTQRDVEELARVLTGWRHDSVRVPDTPRNWGSWSRPMVPSSFPNDRDSGRKQLLGRTFPAGQTIHQDLDDMVALLMAHPNIAPFVSLRLIQHLVKSDPSPAYVQRVGAVFRDNGRGVAGDMKAVVKAVLLDAEARRGDDPKQQQPGDGKLREPMLQQTALLRGMGCQRPPLQPWDGVPMYVTAQEPFNPASVFGYYAPTDRAPGSNLLAPEQKLLTLRALREALGSLDNLVFQTGGSQATALAQAGCGFDEFVSAYERSPSALLGLIGQRYLRGTAPSTLEPVLRPMIAKWGQQPTARTTLRLLSFALMAETYGAMP